MIHNTIMCIFKQIRTVAFQDVDAARIVFFPRFLEYCHDAYFAHMLASGLDLPTIIESGTYILPLVHTEADFARPLRFGDRFEVRVEEAIPHGASFTIHYRICAPGDIQTVYCTVATTHAVVSRQTFTAMKRIPVELRAALRM